MIKMTAIAMVTMTITKYFFVPILMKLHRNDAWDV